jgi:hypothetical protein
MRGADSAGGVAGDKQLMPAQMMIVSDLFTAAPLLTHRRAFSFKKE